MGEQTVVAWLARATNLRLVRVGARKSACAFFRSLSSVTHARARASRHKRRSPPLIRFHFWCNFQSFQVSTSLANSRPLSLDKKDCFEFFLTARRQKRAKTISIASSNSCARREGKNQRLQVVCDATQAGRALNCNLWRQVSPACSLAARVSGQFALVAFAQAERARAT